MPREKQKAVPLLPLRGVFVFPSVAVPLEVGRPKSVAALEEATATDKIIFLCVQKDVETEDPDPSDLYQTGIVAQIKQVTKTGSGNLRTIVEGKYRARVTTILQEEPYFKVIVEEVSEDIDDSDEVIALAKRFLADYEQFVRTSKRSPLESIIAGLSVSNPGKMVDTLTAHMDMRVEDKQKMLETNSVKARLEILSDIIARELEVAEIEKRINFRARKQIERTQKEYYLREQIKAIQKELGDGDDRLSEIEEYKTKIAEKALSKEALERAAKEVERLEKMPPMAAEAVVVRTYLDLMLSLPWNELTEDRLDISVAKKVLDEDHYGLRPAKERILEFLAVRQLRQTMKGPILCFVGPPGVGKTSLSKSIARALDRKFVRISLGGVRDEAEIRGHRRTYIGALPGRIIQGIKQAGSKNPVFLMDEIDKLGSDFRGDPASALLEVLDPEQNNTFSDHYLEVPFDLSKVLFVTTANSLHNIPKPLLDRMEILNLPGYTEDEKTNIAMLFLLPKQIKEHGLSQQNLSLNEGAIRRIIREYTKEAGVRNLEREIATVCRKVARNVVEGKGTRFIITAKNINKYLGIPKYHFGSAQRISQVGLAVGVAVTESGGEIMPVEVSVLEGKGKLILTGKLGDVMRESAQAGLSFVRSRTAVLGIDDDFTIERDVHIHVPEGAIPKDGPSAGITMSTAMVSALTSRPVRHDVAMTGEITLRGRVLPVGGVKEKVLAAIRAGMSKMILPRENERDLEEIPNNVRKKIEFILVEHMDEVLDTALHAKCGA